MLIVSCRLGRAQRNPLCRAKGWYSRQAADVFGHAAAVPSDGKMNRPSPGCYGGRHEAGWGARV